MKSLEQFQDTYDTIVGASNRALTAADLQLMVRWGRLIHTVRLPLLFTKLRDELFVLAGSSYICTVNPAALRPTPVAAQRTATALPAGPAAAATAPVLAGAPDAANIGSAPPGGRVRAPTGPSSRDTASPPPQTAPTTEAVTLAWYRELLATFVRDYVAYLNSIELSLVFTDTAELGSTFVISETVFVPTPRVFLMHVRNGRDERRQTDLTRHSHLDWTNVHFVRVFQKFDIGFLLVELSLENMFVCVNMYTLRSRRVLAATAAAVATTSDGGATQQLGASTEVQKKYQVGDPGWIGRHASAR